MWHALGVGTNFLPALTGNPVDWLIGLTGCSGTSIAIEGTLEKGVAAELLPRELCSLDFGFLACANGVGAMAPSLHIGYLREAHHAVWALGIAASMGLTGVLWMVVLWMWKRRGQEQMSGGGS